MRLSLFAIAALAPLAIVAAASSARADDDNNDWVDRPLALEKFHAKFEAGLGFGQASTATGQQIGTGMNLEGAVGLPFLGEVSLRSGYRFGSSGANAQADYYGRMFDHETALAPGVAGTQAFANPEIALRSAMVDLKVFAIGFETRLTLPIADNTVVSVSPGLPIRIRIPGLMRIDTGVFVPVGDSNNVEYTISVPVAAWFQVHDAFFGPMSGVRFNHLDVSVGDLGGTANRTDVTAGFGGGYTLGGMLDIKAQVYTQRINDASWSDYLGGGVGVALLIP